MNAQQISDDTLVTTNGMVYTFKGNGSCIKGGCYVKVDINGSKQPNKEWVSEDTPGDIITLKIRNINNNYIMLDMPDNLPGF